jgi:hypothetical protein
MEMQRRHRKAGYSCRARHFPWSSPSLSDKNAPPDTIWIPSASESQAVEVLVFLVKRTEIFQHEYSQDTGLVGDIYFRDEGGVRLLYRHVQFETPPNFSGTPRYFRGISSADLSGASRMVSWADLQMVPFGLLKRELNQLET